MSDAIKRYDPGPRILYCCVAAGGTVLAEYYEVSLPGADKIVRQILAKTTSGKSVLRHEALAFCLFATEVATVVIITGESFPQERAFDFIDDVYAAFVRLFNVDQLRSLAARSLNSTFAPMIKQKIVCVWRRAALTGRAATTTLRTTR